MNKRQKEVQQKYINNEKDVLDKLENIYEESLYEIETKIAILLGRDDSSLQNVIFQVEHQKSLKKQIQSTLEKLQSDEFETVSDYLVKSYEDVVFVLLI